MRILVFLCISFACAPALAAPRDVATDNEPGTPAEQRAPAERDSFSWNRFAYVLGIVEVIIPDIRLQTPERIADGVDAVVVSFPVHLAGLRKFDWPWSAGTSIFIEPAIPASQTAVRGLAGLRAFGAFHGFGAVVEGGGMGATDGSGAFIGGGPALGGNAALLALVGRRYVVAGDDRWDFTLDLTVLDMTLLGAFSMEVESPE